MKRWNIKITKEAKKDFQQLDNSLKKQVAAGIIFPVHTAMENLSATKTEKI